MRQRRPSEDNASYVTPELLVFNRPIFKNIVSVPLFAPPVPKHRVCPHIPATMRPFGHPVESCELNVGRWTFLAGIPDIVSVPVSGRHNRLGPSDRRWVGSGVSRVWRPGPNIVSVPLFAPPTGKTPCLSPYIPATMRLFGHPVESW